MKPSEASIDDLASWDVLVGRIKGRWDHANLRIVPFSDVKNRFAAGAKLCAVSKDGARKLLVVRESRRKDGLWICDCDILAMEAAEALVGAEVFIHKSMRPKLPAGKLYPDEFIGMRLQTENGDDLGEIEEVLETPHHEVLVSAQAMVPDVPEFIISVDKEAQKVVVRDVEGLRIED